MSMLSVSFVVGVIFLLSLPKIIAFISDSIRKNGIISTVASFFIIPCCLIGINAVMRDCASMMINSIKFGIEPELFSTLSNVEKFACISGPLSAFLYFVFKKIHTRIRQER